MFWASYTVLYCHINHLCKLRLLRQVAAASKCSLHTVFRNASYDFVRKTALLGPSQHPCTHLSNRA